MVRAKFTVSRVEHVSYSPTYSQDKVVLTPQYDPDQPEDQRFCKATPCGEMWMQVDNPAALAELIPGRTFYVDFTPVGPK